MYRTGDCGEIACRRRTGVHRASGQQVKIRGFRIELGEIEAVLVGHGSVREVGSARESRRKRREAFSGLCDFARGSAGATVSELRSYLREKLPEYMIPSALIVLDEMPLTPSGKVDRRALPRFDAARAALGKEYVAPRNASEEILTGIWSEVLGVEQVGIHDNFFELGGDSIRSIQVISKAEDRGLKFSIQQLFEQATVAQLVERVSLTRDDDCQSFGSRVSTAPFSLLTPADRERIPPGIVDAYPLTRLQAGMIFHSEFSPEGAVYHDIFSYELRAPLDEGAMRETLAELLRRHAALRTGFAFSGYSEPLQLVHEALEFPLVVSDISDLGAAEQDELLQRLVEAGEADSLRLGHAAADAHAPAPAQRRLVSDDDELSSRGAGRLEPGDTAD